MARKLLVTSALPYANGSLHLGHMVEFVQTDIWVRYQKLIGNTCYYMGADDTHGTPIMISAQKQGITPEALIQTIHQEHVQDLKAFHIEFDHYYTTHSPENETLSQAVFKEAQKKDSIEERMIEQLYCPSCAMFLPDRFIRGTCPKCDAPDQYGDACEKCSTTYDAIQLKDPKCAQCGSSPILKQSAHYFFKLSQYAKAIETWMKSGAVPPEVCRKLEEWFTSGIQDWDISRDAPYFGFLIPGTTDKYFYVWVDAPIGYMATTHHWCQASKVSFDSIWKSNEFEIHHFIGKDIIYFHTLFWPGLLMASGYSLPKAVHVHGFLTVKGEKMSKSRGTFVNARTYLNHLDPEMLRYYLASKLTPSIQDLDFNPDDFMFKVNSDVVNKVVNIASRLGSIVNKKLGGVLSAPDAEGEALLQQLTQLWFQLSPLYEGLDYAQVMRLLMDAADTVNRYIDTKAPWSLANTDPNEALKVCTTGLNALLILSVYLKPVLPKLVEGIHSFLNANPDLKPGHGFLTHHAINTYSHLAKRVEPTDIQALFETNT